jgi:predicted nucleic acid-binding protein
MSFSISHPPTLSRIPRPKKGRASGSLVAAGGVASVQVLTEVADVARRKFRMEWQEVDELLAAIKEFCRIDTVSLETHDHGLRLARRFGYRVYDSMILASAIAADCKALLSEDMHDGQRIEGTTIRNPFK